ncbi:virulence-associated protein E [Vineibacter terrae]|uniref:Virulence-associated protein E n=1 Tax=Vineibacter terrae TaxID=2586908 RepID=A0A5C8PN66_9HYPH|nr:toprim domain-containing protein [Vineibacter terrae]TXL75633.1 virulence-associated protein E [Vineibacter terrae]
MSTAHTITAALGGRWHGRYGMVRCVSHDDRSPSLMLSDGESALLVRCFAGCDPIDILAELRRRNQLDEAEQRTADAQRSTLWDDRSEAIARGVQIFGEAHGPLHVVQAYLRSRGLGRLPPDCVDIRFHTQCPRGRDRLPAMVALMRDAITNEPTGVHRTYLRPDGSGKADVQPAKMMLGRSAGAVVKLTPDEDVTLGLGLSEGIEDGLAIINSGWRPIWACMSTGSMRTFPVLGGIEALTLFRDADAPGRDAAEAAAARWRDAGRAAAIVAPAGVKDFAAMAEAVSHAA